MSWLERRRAKKNFLKYFSQEQFDELKNTLDEKNAEMDLTLEKIAVIDQARKGSHTQQVGTDIDWKDIANVVFRVLEFDQNGTKIVDDDKIVKSSKSGPYGYLLVDSPAFDLPVRLPITNQQGFGAVYGIWTHPLIKLELEDRELLVTCDRKKGDKSGSDLYRFLFAVTPNGMLRDYYAAPSRDTKPELSLIFGEVETNDNRDATLTINPNELRFKQIAVTLEAIKAGTVSNEEKKRISHDLIRKSALFSSQMKTLVERVNTYYEG